MVPRPENKSFLSSRWIFKVKYVVDEKIEKHKAKFMAKGHSQVEGIYYEETFCVDGYQIWSGSLELD